jgi:polysaccharide pyruvyl transferase WcaK-like protein
MLPVMPDTVAPLAPQAIFAGKPLCSGYLRSLLTLIYRVIYTANSSGVVYAGGSTFWHMPLAKRIFMRVVQVLGKPLIGIGVSIGPFRNQRDRQRISRFLQHFSYLALRDRASYEEAKAMTLPYAPVEAFDLAVLLPKVYGPMPRRRSGSERLTLGVGLCHYERHYPWLDVALEASREGRLRETLLRLAKREHIRVLFYVFNGSRVWGDVELAQEMAATLKPFCPVEVVPYTRDPGQMWRRFEECDAFLAVRLHSAVFAYVAGIPFALVEYHRKCADFAQDVGLPRVYRFSSSGPEPAVGAETLSNLLHAPQYAQLALNDAQAKAELNFTAAPWCAR